MGFFECYVMLVKSVENVLFGVVWLCEFREVEEYFDFVYVCEELLFVL